MPRSARVELFSADEIAVVHVMNRTVRRCFLMGKDPYTGHNFDHAKNGLKANCGDWLRGLGLNCFAMQLCQTISTSSSDRVRMS